MQLDTCATEYLAASVAPKVKVSSAQHAVNAFGAERLTGTR
jgi:hypothetical protein